MEWLWLFGIGLIATFIGTLSGSGGLINVPAMILLGLPIHSIISANKFSNMLSSFSSFFVLLRRKELVMKEAFKTGPIALVGGVCGGLFASSLSEQALQLFAASLLIAALGISFLKKRQSSTTLKKVPTKALPFLGVIGWYDGSFGPGQATLQMHLFRQSGLSYLFSIGLTRFNTFLSCTGAVLVYFMSGHLNMAIAIPLAIGSITGAQISVRIADKLSLSQVNWLLRTMTILLICQVCYSIFSNHF
ncbi:sulfite exporter TauE/SafE family protein [Guptibacillus algicola]|uniref:sulfite exporter TauE/SafE family protein n=1 Tax=Guptibacillus algicola TaxID=225844 RepID=UPI001CD5993E|nr:sulfite exporter TauE/SafE family protein [Alkalihalobacillus algicola]MCA0987883.1 sulfite exporter TauE/SafE family protein [Alkalihalobacillus algicola]